ncbi:MAG: protein-export membrane protein SecF [Gammaproteobacteria bacterium RIFCSPLOWO2_12_FULL_52_10]|nr:MAG: protein-export membrane protein SecF [Gammaproteobacteria bacterium RIFCSPLOWO2_12_FULL_52_10]
MEFFHKTNIDFMSKKHIAFTVSGLLILAAIGLLIFKGLNWSIDFTGGTLVEVRYSGPGELEQVRADLANAGFGDAMVQNYGTIRDALIRVPPRADTTSAEISDQVLAALPGAAKRRGEYVGPQVGEELKELGGLAMLFAMIGILIYIAIRFERRFALGAVAAIAHDVIVTVGVVSLLGMNFDLQILAALLAVIGYSLNDTIVVYDRIRENFRKVRQAGPEQTMNTAINETLSRTIMTGVTTLMVLSALFVLGGASLQPFAATLIIGILFGTYSSVYVASAITLVLGISRLDLLPVQKEGV